MEYQYKSLHIVADSRVAIIYLNRPERLNALSRDFFTEFPIALASLDESPDVAVVVLAGAGKHFCSGIDVDVLASGSIVSRSFDPGRTGEKLRRDIKFLQDAVTAIERCRKPVIAAIHGACIGGAVDIITACDIRYCSADAFFSVKEVDLAITADLGTLQRLPSIVGFGNATELCLTGRKFTASEAKELGLISKVFATKEALEKGVRIVAQGIAEKSQLAIIGTKAVLLKSRDLTMDQALDYVATWNSGVLLSDDLKEAISAQTEKRKPIFARL